MFAFSKIQDIKSRDFTEIYKIYLHSFPLCERRSLESLEKNTCSNNRFEVLALKMETELVGFINYWKFDSFIYIEHFALKAEFRNKDIGSECLKIFMKDCRLAIILEVEIANSDLASRRISFYEKLGFNLLSHDYMQPPYDGISKKLPMHIMCNNLDFGNENFELIKNTLYNKVYNCCK